MEKKHPDNPLDWDTARVVRELCTDERSWIYDTNFSLPDANSLRKQLEFHEIDGFVLLNADNQSLVTALQIPKLRQQLGLLRARDAIQALSIRNQDWPVIHPGTVKRADDDPIAGSNTVKTSKSTVDDPKLPTQPPIEGLSFSEADEALPHPKKRKRVVPTTLIKTKHDDIANTPDQSPTGPVVRFLDADGFDFAQFVTFDGPADSDTDDEIQWFQPKAIPNGRRQQVNRFCKKFLLSARSAHGDFLDGGYQAGDDLLPFGESGSEVEYDSETLRELADDKESSAEEDTSARDLDQQATSSLISTLIQEIRDSWQRDSLPILERRQYRIWAEARKRGTRQAQILHATTEIARLTKRIAKLRDNLVETVWANESELRLMRGSLETTVHDVERWKWTKDLLHKASAPPKSPLQVRQNLRQTSPNGPAGRKQLPASNCEESTASESESLSLIETDLESEPVVEQEIGVDLESVQDGDFGYSPSPSETLLKCPGGYPADSDDVDPQRKHRSVTDIQRQGDDYPSDERHAIQDQLQHVPQIAEAQAIFEKGADYWLIQSDPKRAIVAMLFACQENHRAELLRRLIEETTSAGTWSKFVVLAMTRQPRPKPEPKGKGKFNLDEFETTQLQYEIAIILARLFDDYTRGSVGSRNLTLALDEATNARIKAQKRNFHDFWVFLRDFAQQLASTTLVKDALQRQQPEEPVDHDVGSTTESDAEDQVLQSEEAASGSADHGATNRTLSSAKKAKKRHIKNDKAAQNLRKTVQHTQAEQERRRELLHASVSNAMPRDQSRLIINESKRENEGLIYVDSAIAGRIKDHQIDGVRFMWNQIVSTTNPGCLLAHTMGLGKTMQVITLLIAIMEASQSQDISISSQVPPGLKSPKILILCPSGLINNWDDEFLQWDLHRSLGMLHKVHAELSMEDRIAEIKTWAAPGPGGILLLGYPMLRNLTRASETDTNNEILHLLQETPAIVVTDEAHTFKNKNAKISHLVQSFKAKARIALTGSPLANNVKEYYTMIDWVSPNYLGPAVEFQDKYATPIEQALDREADRASRKKGLKMLRILDKQVAPKVHRRTIAALKDTLPKKQEFLVYLDLQPMQQTAYNLYIESAKSHEIQTASKGLFSLLSFLGLLLAHPQIMRDRLLCGTKEMKLSETLREQLLIGLPPSQMNTKLSYKMTILYRILLEANKCGDNTLVFSQHLDVLSYVEAGVRSILKLPCRRLDGNTTSTNQRQQHVKDFNQSRGAVYLISTTAGGVGLNITGANRIVILDSKFNPVHEQQAIGRAYRIGQRKPVTVYWLIYDGTFEKSLQSQSVFKQQLQARVNDKKKPIPLGGTMLNYYQPYQKVNHQSLNSFMGKDSILDTIIQDAELAQGISSLDMTDTFEEEEPSEELTAEELSEADSIAAYNQLRVSNPAEWARVNAELESRARLPIAQVKVPIIAKLYNTMPSTIPATMPTTIANTMSSTMPTTVLTTIPNTMSSTMPTTMPITMPSTMPTTMPNTMPTTMPSTMPSTTTSALSLTQPASTSQQRPVIVPYESPNPLTQRLIAASTREVSSSAPQTPAHLRVEETTISCPRPGSAPPLAKNLARGAISLPGFAATLSPATSTPVGNLQAHPNTASMGKTGIVSAPSMVHDSIEQLPNYTHTSSAPPRVQESAANVTDSPLLGSGVRFRDESNRLDKVQAPESSNNRVMNFKNALSETLVDTSGLDAFVDSLHTEMVRRGWQDTHLQALDKWQKMTDFIADANNREHAKAIVEGKLSISDLLESDAQSWKLRLEGLLVTENVSNAHAAAAVIEAASTPGPCDSEFTIAGPSSTPRPADPDHTEAIRRRGEKMKLMSMHAQADIAEHRKRLRLRAEKMERGRFGALHSSQAHSEHARQDSIQSLQSAPGAESLASMGRVATSRGDHEHPIVIDD